MTNIEINKPHYLFEVSWEVCNKVGGIHTVLATKALNMANQMGNNHILIGPDVWMETEANPEFIEEPNLLRAWKAKALKEGLRIRVGRWNVVGTPIAILVDFSKYIAQKDSIFASFWERYKLDSISGGWDYIESALFGYAAGRVIESFFKFNIGSTIKAVAHFHEWMTGAGVLYLKESDLPIATLFTTHATVVGRSIAGNHLPLYDNIEQYSGDEMAKRFNITAKHSLEKCAANQADVFSTVSSITAKECAQFLLRKPDIITPNGFENSFTPKEKEYAAYREAARERLRSVASVMTGGEVTGDALMVAISGRYEYKNKGIDVFLDSVSKVNNSSQLKREIIAWIFVPAGENGPVKELEGAMVSHRLHNYNDDPIVRRIKELFLLNKKSDKVKVLFVPSYLNGSDGIFNMEYYQLLSGVDLTLFPSYYEPWGYTPLESLAFGVPTITTTLAGFGMWVLEHSPKSGAEIAVLPRGDSNYQEVVDGCSAKILEMSALPSDNMLKIREKAKELANIALWDNQIIYYRKAYAMSLDKVKGYQGEYSAEPQQENNIAQLKSSMANGPNWSRVIIIKKIPDRLLPLESISHNLWWSWNQEAIELFKLVDKHLWKECEGNPIQLLNTLSLKRYKELEKDAPFLKRMDEVYQLFNEYMEAKKSAKGAKIAYFSMEYGLDKSLKIYSGGLGVLAGDYLKEASDMMVPMTAVGLLYKYGYFNQKLSAEGDQISEYEPQDFRNIPVAPIRDKEGNWLTIKIALPGRNMSARLWKSEVGRTDLILLDTDFEDNLPEDRAVTHHLYGGDWENRFKQEMLLGIGGIRALRELGVEADVYHVNEGHAAFLGLERAREYVVDHNLSFDEALEVVRGSSLFTTHTPVPAGHDYFSEDLMRSYLSHYPARLKITWESFIALGKRNSTNKEEKFSMSNLAANLSQEVNGVSKLHGEVSREILSGLWPGYLPDELHVSYVTNGVHYPTWTAPEWKDIHYEVFGKEFQSHHYDKECFKSIYDVDDSTIWFVRNRLRSRLMKTIRNSLSNKASNTHYNPEQIIQIKESLRDDVLTIGFARRFATYKRAHLLFTDLDRLNKIVNNPEKPVQFIFAGKAHPADKAGQDLIKKIVQISITPPFIGRILFIPGYDMTLAKHMVQGVDVWMNTPTRPLEASGTSGEKAAMNGVMHFSVLDGWWVEGYKEGAGWALPQERSYENQSFQDQLDATTIYNLFESEIVPFFYKRSRGSILPEEWIAHIKNTIALVASEFTTNRMMTDYMNRYYNKLAKRHSLVRKNQFEFAKEMALWKRKVRNEWPYIEVLEYSKPEYSKGDFILGETYDSRVVLSIGDLSPNDIGVEMLIAKNGSDNVTSIHSKIEFELVSYEKGVAQYRCEIMPESTGAFNIASRIYPKNEGLPHRQDFDLVKWL